ncbi:thioredoxin domain-containing protein [Rugosimonospora acidiphila]|uniref:Thioredoxin domain-containing protein n=1 Tax=Rugosimonospora acidiphila TaxID=556531 RepID=A0ABP9SGX9_9ACTN
MANRLAGSASPYLEQHKDNPVDWWPWDPQAFEEARRRDVPVLISVGYAACHWCHVMAHESFEDQDVARLLNERFVAIKVDREERPDVDAVYMTATQAMTGQGGWPMTVFATPDGEPFFCGTYFPRPAFTQLLGSISEAWRDQRDAVLRQGAAVVEAIGGALATAGGAAPMSAEVLDAAASGLSDEFDEARGGFGGAPKFPPHLNLLFLLRHYQRTGSERSLEIVRHTAEQMARGGVYDQLAGGFARYSVDATWTVPHFEKMLYDNALLLRVYTQLWRLTGDSMAARVAAQTVEFLGAGLSVPEGGFASALDADTEGEEGLTYVWTPAQLSEALGEADGAFAADLYGVTPQGTFERGSSVLRLARDLDDEPDSSLATRAAAIRTRLHQARSARPQPSRDDKVVAAWNGLAVTALAEYAALRHDPDAARLATAAATLLAERHLIDGRLRRVSRDGAVGRPAGVLEDYGCVAEAFCAMHQLTGEGRWLELAGQLLDAALAHFGDGRGGFYDTADDAEALVSRPADPTDNATPSGLSAMAAALTAYGALSGQARYLEAAQAALATVVPVATRFARFAGYSCAVGEALLSGPYEIAIVAASGDPRGAVDGAGGGAGAGGELLDAAWRLAPPGAVIVAGAPDRPGAPLLRDRPTIGGAPTAYVCRGFVCDRPVTDLAALEAQLRG